MRKAQLLSSANRPRFSGWLNPLRTFAFCLLLSAPGGAFSNPRNTPVKIFNGIEYLPLSGVVANSDGRCWWVVESTRARTKQPISEDRFVVIMPAATDSLPQEYLFLPDSALVIHNGKRLYLPLPPVVEKGQLYLPTVVLAGMFPELDVPVLNSIETMTNQETIAVRLLLNPLQGKKGPLVFHRERRSSLELRLILGCRTDSGFVQELGLLSLTSRFGLLNALQLDTSSVGTTLIWAFRVPVQETIINRANGIEVRFFSRPPRRVTKIVLDPGHGGKDPGAIGKNGTEEKAIVLDIAQRIKKHLLPKGFEVLLTRERDESVTLTERVEKATRTGADLFVSIHTNWAPNPRACGLETYFLSEAKTDWERAVASRENAVFERELSNPLFKKDDPVRLILADLAQNEFLVESSELASKIQETTLPVTNSNDRGVRQANFYVLRNIFMPAVLVECGFLSNPREEKLLRKAEHREKIARAVAKGIVAFTRDYERRLNGKQI